MRSAFKFCLAAIILTQASSAGASSESRDMLIQVIMNGSTVSATSLPADTMLHIESDKSRMDRTILEFDIVNTTTANGHAVIVAT